MNQQAPTVTDPHDCQLKALHLHLATIRRNMEEVISENRQLRDALTQATQQLTATNEQCAQLQHQYLEREEKHGQARQCVHDAIARIEQLQGQIEEESA
ncbi:MAG: hypothetical protein R8J84_06260 [Mariprofundales bacterium]